MARCERCDGNHMVYVTESYVDRVAPGSLDEDPAQTLQRRAAARESVFPCPLCNRPAFLLWQQGHLSPDHDRSDCAQCAAVYGDPPPRPR